MIMKKGLITMTISIAVTGKTFKNLEEMNITFAVFGSFMLSEGY